jgi:hypothetical protein
MQNGLPSRMHQLSITQGVSNSHPTLTNHGVPDIFQLSTDKDPNRYGVKEDGVPDSILLASGMNSPNDDTDKSDNSDPLHCDIMPCPMHLVTVKVKVDSSLLIKIIVSIKVILVLVGGFSLLQNLNIKLPSTYLLRKKEVKRVLYFGPALTEVYLRLVLKLQ